jgi:von Willebrand factor type A domain
MSHQQTDGERQTARRAAHMRRLILGVLAVALACLAAGTTSAVAATPAHTDVMFLFDTSGSMGGELEEAKEEMLKVMSAVNAKLPDVQYGVAEVEDYPFEEDLNEEEVAASEEKPWKLDQALTSDLSAVQKAIEPLHAGGGGDAPESYGRALWETDTNPTVGWREGAQHIIILIADNVPHDENLNEGLPESVWVENPFNTGKELPGKWAIPGTQWTSATNLDFQSIASQLTTDGKPLEDVDFSGEAGYLPYWEYWAGLSGGHALGASEKELAAKVTTLIETGATAPLPPCPAGQVRNAAGVCVVQHATSTQVICNLVIATATDTCTATVGDATSTTGPNPTGAVGFTSANGGTFLAGNGCTLAPTPLSGNTSSCSVQFLPPASAVGPPQITATYAGDTLHAGSSGQTVYPPLSGLVSHVSVSKLGTLKGSNVEIPVGCEFPCVIEGELFSGPDLAKLSSVSALGGKPAVGAAHGKKKKGKKKKKKSKPVLLGKGTVTLGQGGKGTLIVRLSAKAKRALSHLHGKGAHLTLKLTIRTTSGAVVGAKTIRVEVRPISKKKKRHGKKRH